MAAAPRPNACQWCDYRLACGPSEELRLTLAATNGLDRSHFRNVTRLVADVVHEMDRKGFDTALPVAPQNMATTDLFDLSSGYLQRAAGRLPVAGTAYPGDLTAARAYLELGFHISLSGIVTSNSMPLRAMSSR